MDRSIFCFVTFHASDRRSDRRTDGLNNFRIPRLHSMQRGKNVAAVNDIVVFAFGSNLGATPEDSPVTTRALDVSGGRTKPTTVKIRLGP